MNLADWLTAILSPATFAFVLFAELRFRRRFAAVSWWLHFEGSHEDDETGELEWHSYTLMNLGSDSATNFHVDATSGIQTQGASIGVVKSGENHQMTIRSKRFDQDWMLLTWINADDRRYIRYQWYPLNTVGPLEDCRLAQLEKARPIRWWNKPKAVGPGAGSIGTRVVAFKGEKSAKGMQKARSLLETTRANPPQTYENGSAN